MPDFDGEFTDAFGVAIRYYRWDAVAPTKAAHTPPRAIVQIAHGLGEYALRYDHLARALNRAGYTVYANDHRGHGQTGLTQWGGDHSQLGHLGPGGLRAATEDIHEFTAVIAAQHPGVPLVLLGHSWGSIMGQRIINQYSQDYSAAVLTGTAYLTPGNLNSGNLNAKHKHLGTTGYEWLSRDVEISKAFLADPLTFYANPLKLFGLRDSLRFFVKPAKNLPHDIPLLVMIGSEDPLGGPESVQKLVYAYGNRSALSDVTLRIFPESRHEIFNELDRDDVARELIDWLDTPGRLMPTSHQPARLAG